MYCCDLNNPIPPGYWGAEWNGVCDNYDDANEVIRTHRPHLNISMRALYGFPLYEMTYKDLAKAIDPNFLKQGIRARALRGVRYSHVDRDTMIFYVTSSEIDINGVEYMTLIKFLKWDEVCSDPDFTPREKAMMLLWVSDVQLHCDDPSFLFWGYQYILSQLGASVYQEPRYPNIRNPGLRGVVCKHLNRVLRALPFYNGDLAKVIRDRYGGPREKAVDAAIQRREEIQAQVNAGDAPPGEQELGLQQPSKDDENLGII